MLSNFTENLYSLLSVELFILFFLFSSFFFYFYIYTTKTFFYPLLLKSYLCLSFFVTVLAIIMLANSLNIEFLILNNHVLVNSLTSLFKFLTLFALGLFFIVS